MDLFIFCYDFNFTEMEKLDVQHIENSTQSYRNSEYGSEYFQPISEQHSILVLPEYLKIPEVRWIG